MWNKQIKRLDHLLQLGFETNMTSYCLKNSSYVKSIKSARKSTFALVIAKVFCQRDYFFLTDIIIFLSALEFLL